MSIRYSILFAFLIPGFAANAQVLPLQDCANTSFRKSFFLSNDTIESISQFNTMDLGKLIVGRHKVKTAIAETGFLLKLNGLAEVQWAQDYAVTDADKQVRIVSGVKLKADQYLLSARVTSVTDPIYNKTLVIKVNPDGNISWSKLISTDPVLDANAQVQLQALNESSDGSILLCGTIAGDLNGTFTGQYGFVVKLADNGDLLFSKLFVSGDGSLNDIIGIFDEGSSILVFGMVEDGNCPGLDIRAMYTMSLNSIDGSIIGVHRYCFGQIPGINSFGEFRHNYEVVPLAEGFSFYGFLAEGGSGARDFLVATYNSNGELVSAKSIKDPLIGHSYHNINVDQNGTIVLVGQHPLSGLYTSIYNKGGLLLNQTEIDQEKFDNLYFLAETGQKVSINGNGSFDYATNSMIGGQSSIDYLRLNEQEQYSSGCLGMDTSFQSTAGDFNVDVSPLSFSQVIPDRMLVEAYNLSVQPLHFSSSNFCSRSSNCDVIKLGGKDTLCAGETSSSYIAHRNPGCFQKISWEVDSSLTDHWQAINDSTIQVFFKPQRDHQEIFKLYTRLQGCNEIKDSIAVALLGPYPHSSDSESLCEGDSLQISPGPAFKTYLWQNGSTDSALTIKMPGIYSVIAMSFSGCLYKDSFRIESIPSRAKVSLGPDVTLCIGQSLVLHAGGDFQSYLWQDGSMDSVLTVYNEGLYSVTVSDACSHLSGDTVLVSQRNSCNPDGADSTVPQFIMPGAFTPNGDGRNDEICPVIKGPVGQYQFIIYNRWGQMVFKSAMPGSGWNGRLRNVAQPPGGYVWYCKFISGTQKIKKQGTLLLIE